MDNHPTSSSSNGGGTTSTTSSLWGSIKNAGTKAKLQAEIAYHDREIRLRQQALGVELYDLLTTGGSPSAKSTTVIPGASAVTSTLFHATESSLKEPYDHAWADIQPWLQERNAKQQERVTLEAKMEVARPALTTSEQFQNAGRYVSQKSTQAKLVTEIAWLDRQIQQRKEAFGRQVFPSLVPSSSSAGMDQPKSLVKGLITQSLSKLSPTERQIQQCIDRALADVEQLQKSQQHKQREIGYLK